MLLDAVQGVFPVLSEVQMVYSATSNGGIGIENACGDRQIAINAMKVLAQNLTGPMLAISDGSANGSFTSGSCH